MRDRLSQEPILQPFGSAFGRANFVDSKDVCGKKVLDIGCGCGWCEINFLKRGVGRITALDSSAQALQVARQNIKDDKVDFVLGDATNLPFGGELFDTVVCWEVIEHIPECWEDRIFSEINRVLVKGGKFYLSTPYNSFFSKVLDPAWWLVRHRHYSTEDLVKLGRFHGLKIFEVFVKGGWVSLAYILNMYISKWVFKSKPFFCNFFRPRSTAEYKRDKGFVTIFAKYIKVS